MLKRFFNPIDISKIGCPATDRAMGTSRGTPVDRHYIESFLSKHKEFIKGHILEVGESTYSHKFSTANVSRYSILDFGQDPKDGVYNFNLENPDLAPEAEFDTFISTHTLNFTYEIKEAIQTSCKVLKPGGTFLGTVASYTQLSDYDDSRWGDFWRLSETNVKRLFEECFSGDVQVFSYGNFSSSMAILHGLCLEDLNDLNILNNNDKIYTNVIGVFGIKK